MSPFHKPSPFEFPAHHPLSPPDTNADAMGPSRFFQPSSISVAGGLDISPGEADAPSMQSPESAGVRIRRALGYHNSGLRESRDRTVQRSSRTFVVVIPPPALLQDHGQLGHTLSSGPRHRLQHGLLMPLFPTVCLIYHGCFSSEQYLVRCMVSSLQLRANSIFPAQQGCASIYISQTTGPP